MQKRSEPHISLGAITGGDIAVKDSAPEQFPLRPMFKAFDGRSN
ncbi:hypothetical protein [Paraburkholderia graminis]|uniref:Uncharacterized protein n=1 Tax=Paraburkholderia graminis TaxID=60548 RepID=A0ABD5CS93_9BURK|nr:hypothetical protein [Paraburkholderia graminis]MDR6208137.1 hypothetical protein [Paraburkholderia graminis]